MTQKEIQDQLLEIRRLRKEVLKSVSKAPSGRVRCEMAQGKYPQYYYISEEDKRRGDKGSYIKKKDVNFARKLVQKEYDNLILEKLATLEKYYDTMQKDFSVLDLLKVYNRFPDAKKCLISPYIIPDEDYINTWGKMNTGGTNTYPIENGYLTEKGEIVRSKSEKIIADKLLNKNIPYIYEPALRLENSKAIYPDFKLLNVRTRKEYYLEHFGMMDNPEYCKSAIEKIEIYENNNIYLGEQLLVTMESSLKGINLQRLDLLINSYLT